MAAGTDALVDHKEDKCTSKRTVCTVSAFMHWYTTQSGHAQHHKSCSFASLYVYGVTALDTLPGADELTCEQYR